MNEEKIEQVKLDRSILEFLENSYVKYKDEIYKLVSTISFHEVIGINVKTKKHQRLQINELSPIDKEINNKSMYKDAEYITDEEFIEFQKKYLTIKPLLSGNISRKDIEKCANNANIHFTTLYRWLKMYKTTGSITSLLPKPTGRKKGEKRLNFQVEQVIQNMIKKHYLTKQKNTVQFVINEVFDECDRKNLPPPGKNTIRNRIYELSEYKVLKSRGSASIAKTKYKPYPGKFEKEYPMELIQIDHTPVDIILLDDKHRKPIGRPYLTLAIDIYSRMIVGYYLSLNAPSVVSIAMCISNTILPKDKLLMDLGIEEEWNVWGFPETIHVDNGAEFRSKSLIHSGLLHGINIEFRPVGSSHMGGHVERAIGTLMKAVHQLPGSTKSNIQQKGEYDAEKEAVFTFEEFEKWLVSYITKTYHKNIHTGIDLSPEECWEIGIFGGDAPTGLPPKPSNPESILIDFLPMYKRTVQKNGINLDGINYYDHLLRQKINIIDKETDKKKRFILKRDPRNIKYIWFYEDNTKTYYKIPAADHSFPNLMLWQYDKIKQELSKRNIKKPTATQIREVREYLNSQRNEAIKKTKKARREEQKLKNKDKELKSKKITYDKQYEKSAIVVDKDLWNKEVPDFG